MAAVFVTGATYHYVADFKNLRVEPKSGKRVPAYDCVDAPPIPEHFRKHLLGHRALLVVPLLSAGNCRWGKIDLDQYDLALPDLARRVKAMGLPLITERTKSGGAHLAWYLKAPQSAVAVRGQLVEWAAMLGLSTKVEIFPKQDALPSEGRASGINLPYFGGDGAANYALDSNGEVLTVEGWLDLIERMPQKATHTPGQVNVEAAVDLLAAHWVDGQRDNLSLAVAGTLLRAGVAEEVVQEILDGAASAGGDTERRRTAASVASSMAEGKRIPGFGKLAEMLGPEASKEFMRLTGAKPPPDPLPIQFNPLPVDWITVAPPQMTYCVEPLLPTGTVGLLVAEGGTGKTTFALRLAMSVATGRPFFGLKVRQGRVVYLAAEEHEDTLRRRIHWIFCNERTRMKESGAPLEALDTFQSDLLNNLVLQSAVGYELHLVTNSFGHIAQSGIVQAMIERLPRPLELLIMDPLSRLNGAEENSNGAGTALINAAERITRECGCTTLLAHHTGKISAKDRDTSLYAARGASGLVDAARTSLRLLQANEEDVRGFTNVPPELLKKGEIVQVVHNKSNEGPKGEAFWLRRQALDFELFTPERASNAGAEHSEILSALHRWWLNDGSKPFSRSRVNEASARELMFAPLKVSRDVARACLARAVDEGVLVQGNQANSAGAAMLVFKDGHEDEL